MSTVHHRTTMVQGAVRASCWGEMHSTRAFHPAGVRRALVLEGVQQEQSMAMSGDSCSHLLGRKSGSRMSEVYSPGRVYRRELGDGGARVPPGLGGVRVGSSYVHL